MAPRERLSELSRSVDVGAVFDGQDGDQVELVVDAVDHAVVAAPGAVQPGQAELERLADPVRIGGQGAVQELHRCGRDLLGQPGQLVFCALAKPHTSGHAAWRVCGASTGHDHSAGPGIIEANEQVTFPSLPCDYYPSSGHPLPNLPPHRRVPAGQPQ